MGRKSLKIVIELNILKALDASDMLTCAQIRKRIGENMERDIHFNTVKKYLRGLVEKNMIFKKELPPSKPKTKKGSVLYSKHRFPW